MLETFSPERIVEAADYLLAEHSVETARGNGRLNTVRTARICYGRDSLEIDELCRPDQNERGFRFVYDVALGSIRADVAPCYERTTVLWHTQVGGGTSTLTDNHGQANAVIAHFIRAASKLC